MCIRFLDYTWHWVLFSAFAPLILVDSFAKKQFSLPLLQEIDGKALLLLRSDMMMKYMGLKLGPALKLTFHIDKLKRAWGGQPASRSLPKD